MSFLSADGVRFSSFIGTLLLCCTWTTLALADEDNEPSWILLQYEGLDKLFSQTHQFEVTRELNPAQSQAVCDSISPAGYNFVRLDDFRSSVRGRVPDEDDDVLRHESGYQIHYLSAGTPVYLYPCSDTFFLTPAYEDERSYFLFTYDPITRELALEALAQEKAVAGRRQQSEYDADEIEISYVGQRATFYEYLCDRQTELPESELFTDPICAGTVEQKVRLCASVLNIPYYKNQYTFTASVSNVDQECRETYLDLKNFNINRAMQFMYRCHVTDVNDSTRRTAIYISRSYRNYEVYVSTVVETLDDDADLVKLEKDVGNLFFVTEPQYDEEMNTILRRDVARFQFALTSQLQNDGREL